MIGYVTLGTNDIARAARFYDALLADLGAKRAMETESFIAWASAPDGPMRSTARRSSSGRGTREHPDPAAMASTPATSGIPTATS
jgi:catechol 2,3-dioxygenase-like lactoylglutathione lyase family enzyme